jgi:isoamylase
LLDFVSQLVHWRRRHPVFCRRRWFKGRLIKEINVKDIEWFLPDGSYMTDTNWQLGFAKSLAIYLNGSYLDITGAHGELINDDNFYIIFNASAEPLQYKLPGVKYGDTWVEVINTTRNEITPEGPVLKPDDSIIAEGRSVILLQNIRS